MSSKILVGFLAGAAVGALAGILWAPDKGSTTRKKISGKAGDISDSIRDSFSNLIQGVKDTYSSVQDDVDDLHEKASSKMNTAKMDVKNTMI
ncbi:MAG TPA: YtxH domain-containing protein [Chitinophagaceae bacterium]|nr:YtxH domain-containing protein [Chitinophagaceae bacterium]